MKNSQTEHTAADGPPRPTELDWLDLLIMFVTVLTPPLTLYHLWLRPSTHPPGFGGLVFVGIAMVAGVIATPFVLSLRHVEVNDA